MVLKCKQNTWELPQLLNLTDFPMRIFFIITGFDFTNTHIMTIRYNYLVKKSYENDLIKSSKKDTGKPSTSLPFVWSFRYQTTRPFSHNLFVAFIFHQFFFLSSNWACVLFSLYVAQLLHKIYISMALMVMLCYYYFFFWCCC